MPQRAEVVRVPKVILEKTWTPWMRLWCAVGVAWVVFGEFLAMELWEDWLPIPFGTFFCPLRISSCGVLVDGFGLQNSLIFDVLKKHPQETPLLCNELQHQMMTSHALNWTNSRHGTSFTSHVACMQCQWKKYLSALPAEHLWKKSCTKWGGTKHEKIMGIMKFQTILPSAVSFLIVLVWGGLCLDQTQDAFEFSRCCLHVSPST